MRSLFWSLMIVLATLLLVFSSLSPTTSCRGCIHRLPVYKTLYLERGIYPEQEYHALEAIIEWNEATNGDVIFDIKRLPWQNINPNDAIIVINVVPDYPDVILIDNTNRNTTAGFFSEGNGLAYIGLVDERISWDYYTAIFLHEMGHSLGLEHVKGVEGLGLLMCPTIDYGAQHITDGDLERFCKLYGCDARKYHGQP